MARYLLIVDFQPGVAETPMEEWQPADVNAHLDYYRALNRELIASGELVGQEVLTGPDLAKVVTSDGVTAPVAASRSTNLPEQRYLTARASRLRASARGVSPRP